MHNTSDTYNSEDFSDFLSQLASYWEHLLTTELVFTEAGRRQSQNESMLPHNTSEYSRLLHNCMGGVMMLHIVKKKKKWRVYNEDKVTIYTLLPRALHHSCTENTQETTQT